jgi:type II secretory pathway pseudopilin PulG
MHKRFLKNSGFTFIELIIVISIIITLTALTVPGILAYQQRQAEGEILKTFMSEFKSAQNQAMTTDTPYYVSLDTTGLINFCVKDTTLNCKKIKNGFSNFSPFYIDTLGNIADKNSVGALVVKSNPLSFSSATTIINIGKFGRVSR